MSCDGSEILYGKKQCPMILKELDSMAVEINTKWATRGIAKGLLCIREKLNECISDMEINVYFGSTEQKTAKRLEHIQDVITDLRKVKVYLRYLLIQKALTVGEVGVLTSTAREIDRQLNAWRKSTINKL